MRGELRGKWSGGAERRGAAGDRGTRRASDRQVVRDALCPLPAAGAGCHAAKYVTSPLMNGAREPRRPAATYQAGYQNIMLRRL